MNVNEAKRPYEYSLCQLLFAPRVDSMLQTCLCGSVGQDVKYCTRAALLLQHLLLL